MATENWMSPLNKLIWLQAFRQRAKKVKLRDDREFIVEYKNVAFFKGEIAEHAYVKPVKGLVPCGYFPMSKVTHESWLMEQVREGPSKESIYAAMLDQFIKSKEQGIDVVSEFPNLDGRLASSIRQGFNHVIEERRHKGIKVMTQGGKVFLLKDKEGSNAKV